MTEISRTQERPVILGEYIIEHKATVRQTAREFGISKSTVHMGVTNWNGLQRECPEGWSGMESGWWGDGGAVFVFGYKKSDSQEPLFCLECVLRRLAIDYMLNKSFCIQVQILDEIKSLCYNKHN